MELLQYIKHNEVIDYQPDWGVNLNTIEDFIGEKYNYFGLDYWCDEDGYNERIVLYFIVRIQTTETISRNYSMVFSYPDVGDFSSLDETVDWIWEKSEEAREEKEIFVKAIKKQYLLP